MLRDRDRTTKGIWVQLIWEEFLNIIKEEAGVQVVETWFKAVTLKRWDASAKHAYLHMPNKFVSRWVQENYTGLIKTHLKRLFHVDEISVNFCLEKDPASAQPSIIPAAPLKKPVSTYGVASSRTSLDLAHRRKNRHGTPTLNPEYTFDRFVVGPNSSLAHAAAYAISQNLGKVYNPLYIYGSTGLGKTHLMHAIGHETRKLNLPIEIVYKTSDNFVSEYINAIRCDTAGQFRKKYEQVDLLLLDDVQFFSRKEQTQEVLFHLFNLLFQKNKQIVFSSDTLPQDIIGLHERLITRMQSGLIVDIQLPALETKMAILEKKASALDTHISDEIICYLAQLPVRSIRELEGYLIRVCAFMSLSKQPLTIASIQELIEQVQEKRDVNIDLDTILKTVSKFYRISTAEIKSDKRNKKIAFARAVVFYMMKKLTMCSLQSIGTFIGGRDHTTVRHGVNKIETIQKTDREVATQLTSVEKMIVSRQQ